MCPRPDGVDDDLSEQACGASGNRTRDLLLAREASYHLDHGPNAQVTLREWIATVVTISTRRSVDQRQSALLTAASRLVTDAVACVP